MLDRGYGRIINISSIIGESGNIGQANYAAAKSGLFGLTMSLAQETARRGITVNDVAPGYISTDMVAAVPQEALDKVIAKIPVGRLGEPEEIARTVEFLADPDSSFITDRGPCGPGNSPCVSSLTLTEPGYHASLARRAHSGVPSRSALFAASRPCRAISNSSASTGRRGPAFTGGMPRFTKGM